MVQKIGDINWFIENEKINLNRLIDLNKIPYQLPKNFLEILNKYNGGCVDYDFDYFDVDFEKILSSGISVIYGLISNTSYDDMVENYINPPEFFPEGLVAFGSNGGGNRTCFDYRADSTTNNPPIVYWSHGAPEGRDVSFIANNFDEFLQMLKESD